MMVKMSQKLIIIDTILNTYRYVYYTWIAFGQRVLFCSVASSFRLRLLCQARSYVRSKIRSRFVIGFWDCRSYI